MTTPLAVPTTQEFLPTEGLPEFVPGVYLLLGLAGEVVYVGHSQNVALRLRQHRAEAKKCFNTALFYHVQDLDTRLRIEGILILTLLPPYNKALLLGFADGKIWERDHGNPFRVRTKRRKR
jgi:hypothetical protein